MTPPTVRTIAATPAASYAETRAIQRTKLVEKMHSDCSTAPRAPRIRRDACRDRHVSSEAEALAPRADVPAVADHKVVEDVDVQQLAGLDQFAPHRTIDSRRRGAVYDTQAPRNASTAPVES